MIPSKYLNVGFEVVDEVFCLNLRFFQFFATVVEVAEEIFERGILRRHVFHVRLEVEELLLNIVQQQL